MATRDRPLDHAGRLRQRIAVTVGSELRAARMAAGLSQETVGAAVRMSHAQVGRVERAEISQLTVDQLCRLSIALGFDLSVRIYPAGDALRDAAHNALLDRLRFHLHTTLSWRVEVPLPIPGDRRAWDAVIGGHGQIGVEAETRLVDGQAVARKLALKRRDGALEKVILLVADTRNNRRALAACRHGVRTELPLDSREILSALREGRDPSASGIVLL